MSGELKNQIMTSQLALSHPKLAWACVETGVTLEAFNNIQSAVLGEASGKIEETGTEDKVRLISGEVINPESEHQSQAQAEEQAEEQALMSIPNNG